MATKKSSYSSPPTPPRKAKSETPPRTKREAKPKTEPAPAPKKEIMSKSEVAKKARAGVDLGKPGPGFQKIVDKATPKYGAERAKRIAGAALQKMRKRGQL